MTTPRTIVSYVLLKRSNCLGLVTASGAWRNIRRPTPSPNVVAASRNANHMMSANTGIAERMSHRGAGPDAFMAANGRTPSKRRLTVAGNRPAATTEAAPAAAMRVGGSHLRSTLAIGASGIDPTQEMFDGILEDRGVELVENARAIPLSGHELRIAKDREVPRNGRPRRREVLGNLTRRPRTRAQQAQDFASCRI